MSEENQSSVSNQNDQVQTVIDNTNNFSNELHQMQNSLFSDPDPSETPANQQTTSLNQSNESDDKQIIQISPEIEEEHVSTNQQSENPEKKIEIFNNITGMTPPNAQVQRPQNIPIRQKIANWYTSLEKKVGEDEAKESLVIFIRNISIFAVGSFFVSTIAEYIDNLK